MNDIFVVAASFVVSWVVLFMLIGETKRKIR